MEYVPMIDEEDKVIGRVALNEIREKKKWHRVSIIMVFNSKREFLIHKRAESKMVHGGYYASGAGGCVSEGESYLEAAKRELEEELGIRDTELKFLFDFKYSDEKTKYISKIYMCVYDGSIEIQEEELSEYAWIPIVDVEQYMEENRYVPDDKIIYKRYMEDNYDSEQ